MAVIGLGTAFQASAQSPIEKALKDPQRKAKEAKADMRIMDSTRKTIVADSTAAKPLAKEPAKRKKKKNKCCAVRNKKSS